MGPKQTALRQALDVAFGSLDESAPPGVQAEDVSLQEAVPVEGERMEEASETALPREAICTTPVADFAKLTVSMGMPEWQEVSTPPMLPPVPEQVGPQDMEMAAPELDSIILEEEVMPEVSPMEAPQPQAKKPSQQAKSPEPTFGTPQRRLTPAEEAMLEKYQAQWDGGAQKRYERTARPVTCTTGGYGDD